jgi:hypothetical protein
VAQLKQYGINNFRTSIDDRQHFSKAQMTKAGIAEALQMSILPYRELIGSLSWISNGTRPDIYYSVNNNHAKSPTILI